MRTSSTSYSFLSGRNLPWKDVLPAAKQSIPRRPGRTPDEHVQDKLKILKVIKSGGAKGMSLTEILAGVDLFETTLRSALIELEGEGQISKGNDPEGRNRKRFYYGKNSAPKYLSAQEAYDEYMRVATSPSYNPAEGHCVKLHDCVRTGTVCWGKTEKVYYKDFGQIAVTGIRCQGHCQYAYPKNVYIPEPPHKGV